MKKLSISLLALLIAVSSILFLNTSEAKADSPILMMDVEFTASDKMDQKQVVTVPNLLGVDKVTVDNGEVTSKVNGEEIELAVTNGEKKKVQSGGELIPAVDKFVTNQLYQSYNQDGFAGNLNPYVYSGSYTAADTKYVTEQTSSTYDQNGYKGTLSSYLYSGSYTPSDSMYVSNQTSSYYNSGGYVGSLSSYLYSGSYTPSQSRTETDSRSGSFTCSWAWNGKSWYEDGGYSYNIPSSVYYSSGGFSGTLSQTSRGHTTCSATSDLGYKGSYVGQHATASKSAWASYSGTVTKPGEDTRVYRYQGTVTKSAVDTRVYRFQGNVTKPAVDTRVYRYEGTVTKPEVDTRTYTTYYSYLVTIKARVWKAVENPISTEGLSLNGTSQYFLIPDSSQFNTQGDFTWGALFKPQSLTDQTIVSNDIISIALKDNRLEGSVKTESETVNVGFDSNFLFLNSWNSIAFSLNGKELSLYYNGQLIETKELESDVQVSNRKDLIIGGGYQTGNKIGTYLNAEIKNVSIWNKTLSENEIQQAYEGQFNDTGVGSWNFQNYTTAISYDKSNHNNDAIGKGFTSNLGLYASDIDDLGMQLRWTAVPNASTYELVRDGKSLYSGHGNTYGEDALVSDTSFTYSVTPKGENGIGVAAVETFTTAKGSLEILNIPNELNLSPLTLTGELQKSEGTFDGKIIVKDTRKERNGWKLIGQGTVLTSQNQKRRLPEKSITLKPIEDIKQTRGLKQDLPIIMEDTKYIDDGSKKLIKADSTTTGFGIYEVSLPDNALEVTYDPAYSYVNPDGSPLDYNTSITWSIIPGDE